jgi:hypothetical protein
MSNTGTDYTSENYHLQISSPVKSIPKLGRYSNADIKMAAVISVARILFQLINDKTHYEL